MFNPYNRYLKNVRYTTTFSNYITRFVDPMISLILGGWLTNLSKTGRSSKQILSIGMDAVLVVLSLWGAYTLRLGEPFLDVDVLWHLFLFLPMLTVLLFASFGIYRWVVRSSNRKLFYQLGKACLLSAIVLVMLTYLVPPERGNNPRSIFVIFGLLLTFSTFGVRFVWQSLFDDGELGEPVAIYGAGKAGAMLIQSLHQGSEYRPVILFDDNPALAGTMVGGVGVIEPVSCNMVELLSKHEIERVILAMPSMSTSAYESKIEAIEQAGFLVQTIPTFAELVSGTAHLGQVRDISICDILGRSEVAPNLELLGKCVRGKAVLVTGAGGSIGSELCRQIAMQSPRKLIALDHSEENLYKISEELTELFIEYQNDVFLPVLCSVNDADSVDELMARHCIDTVYHAAAYKHVPIIEEQPEQGVRVNVFGTLCVLDAAISNEVENFVLISTDKAVRPTNSMGATKRAAELVLQAKARSQSKTRISMVRFGNVLGSSGSVVPKFKRQIDQGGPITLTDAGITRYFMTINEAAQLVLQASAIAQGGDVFVLDMGEPVRIEELAESMVRLAGKKLRRDTGEHNDIEIVVKGLRPGEKMHEELFVNNTQNTTEIQKVFTANEAWMKWGELSRELEALSYLSHPSDRPELRSRLLKLAFYGQAKDKLVTSQYDVLHSLEGGADSAVANVVSSG